MSQDKRKPSTGFRKGFLLSSSKKRGKKRTTTSTREPKPTSSALLDVEEEHHESPLLVLTEQEEEPSESTTPIKVAPQESLLHVVESEGEAGSGDDFGLTEIATTRIRRASPLIEEVHNDSALIKEMSDSPFLFQESIPDEQLLQEVRHAEQSQKLVEVPQIDVVSEIQTKSSRLTNAATLPVGPSSEETSATMTTPNAQLVHELPRFLWKLQEHSTNDDQLLTSTFVSENLYSDADWKLLWSFELKSIAADSSGGTSPAMRLGITLLQRKDGLESFVRFLSPTDDKQSRVLALGCTVLIQRYCESSRQSKGLITSKAWLAVVLPRLVKIVLAGSTEKSVLSHECMNASFDIVAVVTERENVTSSLNLESTVWTMLSNFDELLQVQQGWIGKSLPSDNCSAAVNGPRACRKKCSLAVVDDWRLVIQEGLRLYEGILVESKGGPSDQHELAGLSEQTCLQLNGELSDSCAPHGFGGLHQTLSSNPPTFTAEQIVACMQGGAQLVDAMRKKKESAKVQSLHRQHIRTILRGVAGWLAQSKKQLQNLSKHSDVEGAVSYLRQASDLSLILLRCNTEESVALVVAVLDCLWSSSGGLPPDFADDASDSASATSAPAFFEWLLDELKHDGSNDAAVLEPTQRAFCIFITRCIQRQGSSLVKELIDENGLRPSTVEVLANVLSYPERATAESSTDLLAVAGTSFLDSIGTSHYAQKKLLSCPSLLCTLPTNTVVPRLVALAESNLSNDDVLTPIAASMTKLLMSSLPNNVYSLVNTFLESLERCDEKDIATGNKEDMQEGADYDAARSRKVCCKITASWLHTLLDSPICGENGLALVLSAVGNSMFANPSSSVPLALLGSVVGDDQTLSPLVDLTDDQVSRVYFAVVAVVRQSIEELGRPNDVVRESLENGNTEYRAESTYTRLSPLLLLRRMPSRYYEVARMANSTSQKELETLLTQLADQLSIRLDIAPPSNLRVNYSPQERLLTADIAGLCLPFFVPSSCSCYHKICYPAFLSALQTLQVVACNQRLTTQKESLRAARAALYACCNHIPIADDDDDGEGIYATTSFVLQILNADVAQVIDKAVDEDELVQLQTGCIEFIAVCLESTLQRHVKARDNRSLSRSLVEMKASQNRTSDATAPGSRKQAVSMKEALATSCRSIASLVRTGAAIPHQLRLGDNGFSSESSKRGYTNEEPSITARTCMWNAFIFVSQRCQNGALLTSWANLTAPWVLDWASLAPADDSLRHPLCMAAALQVIFVLVTRTKSFDCLAGGKATSSARLAKAHRVAIAAIKSETKVSDGYANIAMRMAGLKLLLALVTVDQMGDSHSHSGCLSPGEVGEIFTLLRDTASTSESDSEVRDLASHILRGMRTS